MRSLFAAALAVLFTSCNHVYYAPNTPNITMLTEKDEVRINAGLISGFDSEMGGGDLQIAYAPAKHFGLMVNAFTASRKQNTESTRVEKGSGGYAEFGLGYLTAFDPEKEWLFEVYGGFGTGGVKNDYGNSESSKVAVGKMFLQPSFSYKWDFLEVGLAMRMCQVSWKVKELKTTEAGVEEDMAFIRGNRNFFTFEPGVVVRAGGKSIKGELGLTASSNQVNEYFYAPPRETIVGYIGISFNFSAKKKVKPLTGSKG